MISKNNDDKSRSFVLDDLIDDLQEHISRSWEMKDHDEEQDLTPYIPIIRSMSITIDAINTQYNKMGGPGSIEESEERVLFDCVRWINSIAPLVDVRARTPNEYRILGKTLTEIIQEEINT